MTTIIQHVTRAPTAAKVVVGGLLGGLVLLGLMGSPKVDAANAPMPPKDVLDRINAALASADPHTIRIAASQVEAAGFPIQATSMRVAAAEIEATIRSTVVKSGDKPAPLAASLGLGTAIKTQADQDARTFAGRVALMLKQAAPGREDKALVRKYQLQEQGRKDSTGKPFDVGKADGLYGPKTAFTFALDHGIVPPSPRYWPKTGNKDAYINALEILANRDTSRREEWQQAIKQV